MCGIVGILRRDGAPADPDLIARMLGVLRHRGPDDQGTFLKGPVGLGHNRLAILDLVTGHQPMSSDGVTVVYNGEIYNYMELREDLVRRGHGFQTSSDTEVLLRLYLEHGPDCVRLLNGMFAFLLWDEHHERLLAARDHLGVKPLYWHASARRLVFASEIKALLQDPEVVAEPDWDAVRDYLTFQYVQGEATLFRGVRKVLPGQYWAHDLAGASRSVRYWEPTFQVDLDHTEKYFTEQLRALIEDAVRIQMRSDVPVGAYLSGGMDSSLVTVLASRHISGSLPTFTGAFREGPEFDETEFAREVADSCGAVNHVVYPTVHDLVTTLPRLVWYLDEPTAGPGVFPQFMVSRLAREHVKVCLGGQGGDEVFGGYARYVIAYLEQALKGAILETNEEGEHIVSLRSILPNLPYLRSYMPMIERFWKRGLFEPMDRRYFRLVDRSAGSLELLSPEFRATFDTEATFTRFQAVFNHPDTRSYFNKMTHYDLVTNLPALLHVEDRASMAASLESRVPLLDRRIVDLVTRMPPPLKFKGAEMKYVLKRAVGDLIPPRVLQRKDKMGFPVPLHVWVSGPARDFVREVLLGRACRERGLFDPSGVERLLGEDVPYDRRLWGLVNLELWFRIFVDERGKPDAVYA